MDDLDRETIQDTSGETEHGNGIGNGGSGSESGAGDGSELGTDDRATGDGDGALSRGGRRSDGDGGGGGGDGGNSGPDSGSSVGDGVGREGGDLGASGASPELDGAIPEPKRGRGRPRKLDGGDRATRGDGSGAGSGSSDKPDPGLDSLGKNGNPKKVADSVFEDKDDLSKLSKNDVVEIMAGVAQAAFFGIANALGHDHWLLSNKDAAELGGAVWDWIKSLPAGQNKKFQAWFKKHGPLVKLIMVGSSILGGRILASVELSRVKKENADLRIRAGATANGNGTGSGFDPGTGATILSDEFIT